MLLYFEKLDNIPVVFTHLLAYGTLLLLKSMQA